MSRYLTPGSALLFMKIGTHAGENLEEIIARKSEEIRQTGFCMWGYGGNTCHPVSMVQPFAQRFAGRGQKIYLCMEKMESNHAADPLCASEYSADGINWAPIPAQINVLGSKYALIINQLRNERFVLPLDQTRVPVGPSMGRVGSRYVKGRVDKACLEVVDAPQIPNDSDRRTVTIDVMADLQDPYAVFLRGQR